MLCDSHMHCTHCRHTSLAVTCLNTSDARSWIRWFKRRPSDILRMVANAVCRAWSGLPPRLCVRCSSCCRTALEQVMRGIQRGDQRGHKAGDSAYMAAGHVGLLVQLCFEQLSGRL